MADSILLLPAPEHREALLGDSPGGGKVPIRRVGIAPWSGLWALADSADVRWNEPDRPHDQFEPALVLRWRGTTDILGMAQLREVILTSVTFRDPLEAAQAATAAWSLSPRKLAALAEQYGFGAVVEVTP